VVRGDVAQMSQSIASSGAGGPRSAERRRRVVSIAIGLHSERAPREASLHVRDGGWRGCFRFPMLREALTMPAPSRFRVEAGWSADGWASRAVFARPHLGSRARLEVFRRTVRTRPVATLDTIAPLEPATVRPRRRSSLCTRSHNPHVQQSTIPTHRQTVPREYKESPWGKTLENYGLGARSTLSSRSAGAQ